jgi:hypothetical protein
LRTKIPHWAASGISGVRVRISRIAVRSVDVGAQPLQEGVRFGQVLAVGSLPDVQVGDRVESQSVDAHLQPVVEDLENGFPDGGVVVVEIGLV